ncbi:MAG: GDP-L-fucose synthase [Saprospiraceae bacterium]
MDKNSKIFIAGHKGMVGSAIHRILQTQAYSSIITRSSNELDLRNQEKVNVFFQKYKPEYVFLAAAKVGGILANRDRKGEFLYDNLTIQNNVIHASYENDVNKLLFLGSSCIYPKLAEQPMKEDAMLTGPLEETNDAYAIAKIAGIKMCDAYRSQYGCNFISAMPSNLYGPNDNYDPRNSHVLPALLRKTIEAKRIGLDNITIWGTGKPMREYLHVDDLAVACLFLMNKYDEAGHINVGSGEELSILNLTHLIKEIVGFGGGIIQDESKPDGTFRKLMDNSKILDLGWKAEISLKEGIKMIYEEIKGQF